MRSLRRHNVGCFLRVVLYSSGALAVFVTLAFFGAWVGSLIVPETWSVAFSVGVIFSTFCLYFGREKIGRQGVDWKEKLAVDAAIDPLLPVSYRVRARMPAVIDGSGVYVKLAARWWRQARWEWSSRIYPINEERREALEKARRHLAARQDWLPVQDWKEREGEIRDLAQLGLASIREVAGTWCVRISLAGGGETYRQAADVDRAFKTEKAEN